MLLVHVVFIFRWSQYPNLSVEFVWIRCAKWHWIHTGQLACFATTYNKVSLYERHPIQTDVSLFRNKLLDIIALSSCYCCCYHMPTSRMAGTLYCGSFIKLKPWSDCENAVFIEEEFYPSRVYRTTCHSTVWFSCCWCKFDAGWCSWHAPRYAAALRLVLNRTFNSGLNYKAFDSEIGKF